MRSAPRLSRERSTSRLCRYHKKARNLDILSINENGKKGEKDVSSKELVIHVGSDPQHRSGNCLQPCCNPGTCRRTHASTCNRGAHGSCGNGRGTSDRGSCICARH